MEQWIYFLNTGEIPDDATAPGLPEAREQLKLDRLSETELKAFYRHLDIVVILRDNINTERAEGRAEGRAEEKIAIARNLIKMGLSTEAIIQATGMSASEILKINS